MNLDPTAPPAAGAHPAGAGAEPSGPRPADRVRARARCFAAQAMATRWEILFDLETDAATAAGAAAAAFQLLERLDGLFSRFIAHSDISRLNGAQGAAVVVAPETMDILRLAVRLARDTDGAFDIAYATPMPVRRALGGDPPFRFIAETHAVALTRPEVRLDLGAIGKGYALDRMAELVQMEWGITRMLAHGGGSTVLAAAPPSWDRGWPVTILSAEGRSLVRLTQAAISATGFEVRGAHIVDPRTGERPRRYEGVWVLAPTAAEADALSTALAVMSPDEVRRWMSARPAGYAARLITLSDGPRRQTDIGAWPTLEPVVCGG